MAKHMKAIGLSKGWKIAIATMAIIVAVAGVCFVCAYGGVLDALSSLFGSEPAVAPSVSTTTPTTTTAPAPIEPVFKKPEQMKGTWLIPGVDYFTSAKDTGDTVKKQLDTAFEAIEEWEFNTLILPLFTDDFVGVYPASVANSVSFTDKTGEAFDPIAYCLSRAREKNLYVYLVLDLHVRAGGEWDPRTETGLAKTLTMVQDTVGRYAADGYFVSGFTFSGKQVETEKRDTATAALNTLVQKVTDIIRTENRDLYTGLLSNGIWAHSSVDERGSQTGEYYEEFTDGCADTLSWLEQGLFDCVMVKDYSSTSHPTASFQNVLKWWDGITAKQQLPLYISHSAATLGSYLSGWKATDQLAQQYLYCKDTASWKGSAYDSLYALRTNKTGAADALKRAYAGTLDEEYIYKQLTVTFPPKTSYTTTESGITLQGGGDVNFPLTVNGKEVELSEHGFFSLNYSLKVGVNTFVFSHKGTTKTYKITYKQTVLQSVSPNTDMAVEGGNPFIISAIARKGSTVTAAFNGATITLKATDIKEDESGNAPSDFQNYTGTYTLPKGKVGQATNLGAVTVSAAYNGLSEQKAGGKITLKALPVPTTPPSTNNPPGTAVSPPNEDEVKIVTVSSAYAETFLGGNAVDDYSRPYNSYLPKGTRDYWVKTVYNGGFSYYLLASGKRVYCKDATLTEGGTITYTPLQNGKTTVTGTHTEFTFDTYYAIPVYTRTRGQQYYRDNTNADATIAPHYGLERYSQTTTHIDIAFHYLTGTPELPDISASPLFSAAQWITEKDSPNAFILRLTLKKTGTFYGVSTKWNGNRLTISFLNPADVSKNAASEKLKGVQILLDPGHGSDNDKPWEAPFNLDYANTLKTKLEALGATVDMTRTTHLGTAQLSLQKRVLMSQTKGYHLVISVHMNGANGNATGATVHYYTECAYTPSKIIYDKMHAVETQYGVGTTANGTPRNSGTVWGTLYMTRSIFHCPSILLECAFLDNIHDKEALINPVYRDKLMQAVTDGVVQYFSQM